MRILSWNIQAGGASRKSALLSEIPKRNPDVLVLTEARESSNSLLTTLQEKGWVHRAQRPARRLFGGVAILSRWQFREQPPIGLEADFPGRWLEVDFVDQKVTVVGIYGPLHKEAHDEFWELAL